MKNNKDERDLLNKNRAEASKSLDKNLLYIATGSLYLSIYTTKDLKGEIQNLCILGIGWGLLLLSVILIIVSIYDSTKAHEHEINKIDKTANEEKNRWSISVEIANFVSVISLIFGLIFLAIFYFLSLGV